MAGAESAWDPAALPMDAGGVASVAGNRRLTAGLDARGNVRTCFWPSPGQDNQLAAERPGEPGACFFLGLGGQIISSSDPSWQILGQREAGPEGSAVETRLALTDSGAVLRQTVSVAASMDILTIQAGVSGVSAAPRIFWYQDFDPRTARIPEAAFWPSSGDFAAFVMPAPGFRAYQFRPAAPSNAQWTAARRLSRTPDAAQVRREMAAWGTSPPSVWVGLASPNQAAAAVCGNVASAQAPLQQARQGRLGGSTVAVGDCAVAVELVPELRGNEYCVTVFLAFGSSIEKAGADLEAALRPDFVIPGEIGDGPVSLAAAARSGQTPIFPEDLRLRALSTLRRAQDPGTGALVRAPVAEPPQCLVSAEVTAWAALALDLAGQRAEAADALRFLRTKVRMQSGPGQPRGSLASAYYSGGVEAAPHRVLDPSASAWLLSGLWRHGAFLSGSETQAWFEESWEAVRASADFLAQWSSGPDGPPLPGYDPAKGRDAPRDVALLHHLMGLNAAIRMDAARSKQAASAWVRRRDELENQLRSRMLSGETSALRIPAALPYWLRGVIEGGREAVWNALAVYPPGTAPLREFSFGSRAEWTQDAGVDAYGAALAYIALAEDEPMGSAAPNAPSPPPSPTLQ